MAAPGARRNKGSWRREGGDRTKGFDAWSSGTPLRVPGIGVRPTLGRIPPLAIGEPLGQGRDPTGAPLVVAYPEQDGDCQLAYHVRHGRGHQLRNSRFLFNPLHRITGVPIMSDAAVDTSSEITTKDDDVDTKKQKTDEDD
ncbi:hypothetical protein CB1_000661034 [Camelus ferus]|nr:hypothetical protein CB1_000661034 [Camelus ferus]